MTSRRSILLSLMLGAFFSLVGLQTANAQVPRSISYQGRLIKAGQPVTGTVNLTIKIYDASGTEKYTESYGLVDVKDGIFNVLLGGTSGTLPGSLNFDEQYFLGINVDGTGEMTPRTPFVASPYALNAELVGGIGVNRVPTPGMLLPLDENGKLPVSVMPQQAVPGTINGIQLDDSLDLKIIGAAPITVTNDAQNRTIIVGIDTSAFGVITAVQGGPGLTGGGSSGVVTISVANNGITTDMLGTGVVTGIKINQFVAANGLYQDILGNLNVGVDATLQVVNDLVGINLSNPNIWLALQTFNAGITVNGTTTLNGPVNINGLITHIGNTNQTGNYNLTGNLVVTGTSDLQGNIFNSTANNGGAVFVNDAFTTTGNTILSSNAGSTTTIGNTTGTLTTQSSTTSLNAVTSITLTAPSIIHNGVFTQTGNSTFTGTITQTGGNVQLAGGTVNNFGTVAGSANTFGATSSINTFNGSQNIFNLTAPGFVQINGTAEPNAVNAASVTNYEFRLNGDAQVSGATNLIGNTFLNQTLTVGGATTLNGATTINNTLNVNGASTFNGNITQTSGSTSLLNTTVTGTLTQSGGNATINGGATNVFGSVAGSTNTIGGAGSTNNVTGGNNNITATGTNTITGTTNNVVGTTNVTGNTTVTGTFTTTGNTTLGTSGTTNTMGQAGVSSNTIQGAVNNINGGTNNMNGATNNIIATTNNFGTNAGSTNNIGSATSTNTVSGLTNVGSLGANGNKLIVNGAISAAPLNAGDYEFIVNGDAMITGTLNAGALVLAGPICAPTVQVRNLTNYCLDAPGTPINLMVGIGQTAGSNSLLATTITNLTVTGSTTTAGITNTGAFTQNGVSTFNGTITQTSGTTTLLATTTGNLTVNGTGTVSGVLTTNGGIVNPGTLNQQGNISSTTGDVNVVDNFNVTGNSGFSGNITQTAGTTTLLVTNTGNLTVTGTMTQSGGNATITGAGTNTFGTVAASSNTIGSTTSTNTINGTTNTIGTQLAGTTVINNIGNSVQVATSQLPPTTSNVLPVLGNQTYSASTNNVNAHVVMAGDNTTTNEHILYIAGAPELQVGDNAPINPMLVANYEVIIQGDLLVTGHIASPSIGFSRSGTAILRRDGLGGDVADGYSTQNVVIAGVLAGDVVTVTYITDNGGSARGILDAQAAAGSITIRSSSIIDDNQVQYTIHRP